MEWVRLNYVTALDAGTAIAALVAACLWWRAASSCVQASPASASEHGRVAEAMLSVDGDDFIATIKLQSLWNKRAAIAATVAAFLQSLAAAAAAYDL
jgi:hypothetical protein